MANFYEKVVLLCILSLLITTKSEALLPFSNYSYNTPGATYDLGTLTSTDIIKVELSWVVRANSGHLPGIQLWLMSGGVATSISTVDSYMTRPTSTTFIYEGPIGVSGKIYLCLIVNGGLFDYIVQASVNGVQIVDHFGAIISFNHIPHRKITLTKACKLKITTNYNIDSLLLAIFSEDISSYSSSDTKEIIL